MARFDYQWHPLKIVMRCAHCGKIRTVARQSHDHPRASLMTTNECNRCEDGGGDFEDFTYYDPRGNELCDDPTSPDELAPDGLGITTSELVAIIAQHAPAKATERAPF